MYFVTKAQGGDFAVLTTTQKGDVVCVATDPSSVEAQAQATKMNMLSGAAEVPDRLPKDMRDLLKAIS